MPENFCLPMLTGNQPLCSVFKKGIVTPDRLITNSFFEENLEEPNDTTKVFSWWSDSGGNVYPADLMIKYSVSQLTESEKTNLEILIKERYPYLTRGLEILQEK